MKNKSQYTPQEQLEGLVILLKFLLILQILPMLLGLFGLCKHMFWRGYLAGLAVDVLGLTLFLLLSFMLKPLSDTLKPKS